jgi:hypothetical protein
MGIGGAIQLGARSAVAAARIGADAVAERFGGALPRTREQLVRPGVLARLLRDDAAVASTPLPAPEAVTLPGIDFESSNCQNFLVGLTWSDDANQSGTGLLLPETAYVKLPCREMTTRVFANATGFWQLECAFCRHVASQIPIRIPQVYAAARRGSRFVLVLENLHEIAGAELFINRDMAAGTTVERARRVLSTFAELHAKFWAWSAERREALLPSALRGFQSPRRRSMTRAMNQAAIAPCREKAPELFPEEVAAICRTAVEKWDALSAVWFREPLTLIHGDSHLGNCFEYPTEDGLRVGMLDFQAVQWSHGIRDVQYFLINSLEPDLLAEHEGVLVDHYLAELAARGVTLDPEEARSRYRAFSFQTLMTAVVACGLGSLTERDATVEAILRRSVAAMRRLDFGGWLGTL